MRFRVSQSLNCSRSSVKVGKVASTVSTCVPFMIRAHTETLFSCTSKPAQRRVYYFHGSLLCRERRTQRENRTFLNVLSALRQRRQSVVPCTTKYMRSGPESQTGY